MSSACATQHEFLKHLCGIDAYILLQNKVFILQIYDSLESDLKLNHVFEFIGVLTFDNEVKNYKNGKH